MIMSRQTNNNLAAAFPSLVVSSAPASSVASSTPSSVVASSQPGEPVVVSLPMVSSGAMANLLPVASTTVLSPELVAVINQAVQVVVQASQRQQEAPTTFSASCSFFCSVFQLDLAVLPLSGISSVSLSSKSLLVDQVFYPHPALLWPLSTFRFSSCSCPTLCYCFIACGFLYNECSIDFATSLIWIFLIIFFLAMCMTRFLFGHVELNIFVLFLVFFPSCFSRNCSQFGVFFLRGFTVSHSFSF